MLPDTGVQQGPLKQSSTLVTRDTSRRELVLLAKMNVLNVLKEGMGLSRDMNFFRHAKSSKLRVFCKWIAKLYIDFRVFIEYAIMICRT